jgi:hypothetical protein
VRCDGCGGIVELARTPFESGLVRLAVLGADAFELRFDDPAVESAAAPLLGPCPHGPEPVWDEDGLRALAPRAWAALEAGAEQDERLARVLALWRPRALRLLGREGELTGEEAVRVRLGVRLEDLARRMEAARAAGDDDEAQRLHARYIEIGMVYAGRLATAWR